MDSLSGLRMQRPKPILRSPFLRKPSLAMLMMAATYTVISYPFWLPIQLGEDFPNCVSGRWDNEYCAVGAMSQHRMSSLFITRHGLQPGQRNWSERRDGHFCNFEIPTSRYAEPAFFNVVISNKTLGWDCPYFLMVALWGWVYFRNRKRDIKKKKQFSILDMMLVVTLVAVVVGLIQLRMQLICTVIMNLLTFGLALHLVYHALKHMLVTSIPWLTPQAD